MADETKRIIDQDNDTSLSAGDYVMVDSQSEGTRKFDLGSELSAIKEDLSDLQEEIEGGGGGLTADLKAALDQLAQKVAYIDDDGADYYDALHSALYPPANLTRISCVYTQTHVVYAGDSLDSLKTDLVVTAHYSNGTTQTVTSYGLSGTLVVGTSTITASYGGKTTTFSVTVSQAYSVTNVLENCTNSNTATSTAGGGTYTATISPDTYYELSSVTVTMNGVDVTSTVYDDGDISIPSVTGDIVITASAYIYSWDTEDGTMKIYVGSSAMSDAQDYPDRIMNNPWGNGNNRRSLFTEIEGVLNVLKKTGVTSYEDTDFYPIPVPPGATGWTVTITTTDTNPYTGCAEYTYSDGKYTRINDIGWKEGATYTYTLTEGTQYITINNKRNSSGTNYDTAHEITRATIVFNK